MDTDDRQASSRTSKRAPRLPPRWVIRTIWVLHRPLYSITARPVRPSDATEDRWGMLRLRTVGRRTGKERRSILGYLEDGPNLVTLAMNGWADPEPAWWLNLQAHPDAQVDARRRATPVRARAAVGEERARLWARFGGGLWATISKRFAARRSRETAVVVLEPRD